MARAPDHQRHEIDAHRQHHRHGEQEHHRRAVHGEDLVVEVGAEEGVVGTRELDAHQRRRACPPSMKNTNAVTMKRRPIDL